MKSILLILLCSLSGINHAGERAEVKISNKAPEIASARAESTLVQTNVGEVLSAKFISCTSDSGKTLVTVTKQANGDYSIYAVQPGSEGPNPARVVLDDVVAEVRVEETFPEDTIVFQNKANSTELLSFSLGSMRGTVSYVKDGKKLSPKVSCELAK